MQNAQVFKFRGEWKDVVNTGEAVSQALHEADLDKEVEQWDKWRPREEERYDHELREKTAKTACVTKNPVEKEGKTAVEEAGEAVGDFGRAVEAATKGKKDTASEKSREAATEFVLSVDTVVRKAVRRFELFVYKHVVTRTNPHYFDNEAVFACIQKEGRVRGRLLNKDSAEQYSISVEVDDTEMSDRLRKTFQEPA